MSVLSEQVSNDGHSYSNAKVLTVYDGGCQRCSSTADGRCALRVCRFCVSRRLVFLSLPFFPFSFFLSFCSFTVSTFISLTLSR